jgi:hypothetical protein
MPAPVQLDVIYAPLSLVDLGLASDYNGQGYPNVLSGLALNTFGLLWAAQEIWSLDAQYVGISTTWGLDSQFVGITTIWTTEYLPS